MKTICAVSDKKILNAAGEDRVLRYACQGTPLMFRIKSILNEKYKEKVGRVIPTFVQTNMVLSNSYLWDLNLNRLLSTAEYQPALGFIHVGTDVSVAMELTTKQAG